ncbi:hypothetical protein ACWHAM_20245 [Paenibacillus terrae]
MKKLAARFSSLLLVGLMLLPTGVHASSSNDSVSAKPAVEGEIVQAYRVTDKGLIELSKEELQAYKAQEEEANKSAQLELDKDSSQTNSQNNGAITPNAINEYYWRYEQSTYKSAVPMSSLNRRVSQYVYNRTQDNATRAISSSTTQTWQANANLTYKQSDAVTATLGGGWSRSTSYTDTTTTVRPNYMSWAEFTPIMDKSFGYLKEYYSLNGSVRTNNYTEIYIARVVSGRTDGILTVKTAPIN